MKVMPLHSAAAGNHSEISKFLVSNGADVNARNDEGTTALAFTSAEQPEFGPMNIEKKCLNFSY